MTSAAAHVRFWGKADTGSLTGAVSPHSAWQQSAVARIALVKSAPLPICKIQVPLVLASLGRGSRFWWLVPLELGVVTGVPIAALPLRSR